MSSSSKKRKGILETAATAKKRKAEGTSEQSKPYYVSNFELMMNTVLWKFSHLFLEEERLYFSNWNCSSLNAKKLLVRMFQRKGPWFTLGDCTLRYKEDINVQSAIEELQKCYFVQVLSQLDQEHIDRELLGLLATPELVEVVRTCGVKSPSVPKGAARREALVDAILKVILDTKTQRTLLGSNALAAMVQQCLEWKSSCVLASNGAPSQSLREVEGASGWTCPSCAFQNMLDASCCIICGDWIQGEGVPLCVPLDKQSDFYQRDSGSCDEPDDLFFPASQSACDLFSHEPGRETFTSDDGDPGGPLFKLKWGLKRIQSGGHLPGSPAKRPLGKDKKRRGGVSVKRRRSRRLSFVWAKAKENNAHQDNAARPLCIRISPEARDIFRRMNRLFFMGRGEMHLLYLASIEKITYPKYACPFLSYKGDQTEGEQAKASALDATQVPFRTREELLHYENALREEDLVNAELGGGAQGMTALRCALKSVLAWILEHCSSKDQDPYVPIANRLERTSRGLRKPLRVASIESSLASIIGTQSTPGQADLVESHFNFVALRPYLARFTKGWIYLRMAHHIVPVLLEQKKRYKQAAACWRLLLTSPYCRGRRGHWWLRLAINLEHQNRKLDSLLVCEHALWDEYVRSGDRVLLQRKVLKLSKPPRRWKVPDFPGAATLNPPTTHIQGKLLTSEPGKKSVFLAKDETPCSVEHFSLQHYERAEGWQGLHSEASVYLTLFGLLFWDILFQDVPGVFQTPFQDAPLDLCTDAFFTSRGQSILHRLSKLEADHDGTFAARQITKQWGNRGVRCRGVYWKFGLSTLCDIAKCLGGKTLACVCKLLAEDYTSWSKGLPDLLLWKTDTHQSKIVEVKGPRDRLSGVQRAWINQLLLAGADVEVCKVTQLT